MSVDSSPSRPPSRRRLFWMWLPLAFGALGCGILGGAVSAGGHPWSEYTAKPDRSPLFRGFVAGSIGAFYGAAVGMLSALVGRAAAIVLGLHRSMRLSRLGGSSTVTAAQKTDVNAAG